MKYVNVFNPSFAAKKAFESQVTKLESIIISENLNCFRDVVTLTEKLQNALVRLEQEKAKLKLLELKNYEQYRRKKRLAKET